MGETSDILLDKIGKKKNEANFLFDGRINTGPEERDWLCMIWKNVHITHKVKWHNFRYLHICFFLPFLFFFGAKIIISHANVNRLATFLSSPNCFVIALERERGKKWPARPQKSAEKNESGERNPTSSLFCQAPTAANASSSLDRNFYSLSCGARSFFSNLDSRRRQARDI